MLQHFLKVASGHINASYCLNQPPHGSLTLYIISRSLMVIPLILGGFLSRSNQSPIIEDLAQAKHQYMKLVRFAHVHRQIYMIN